MHAIFGRGLIVLPLYFIVTLLIGAVARRQASNANSFLNASRSLPLGIVIAAFLAANCGALEVVGLSAMAAQYGVKAFHFYWIGAIPAMVFLALWMMPIYRKSGIRSIPEYLQLRYGPKVRLLNAYVLAITMLLFAGISLYAMAQVLEAVLGVGFLASVTFSASVVLIYILLGGVRATIYNEVFQLLVMVAGLTPLAWRTARLALDASHSRSASSHLWIGMPVASTKAPLDGVGIVVGLGFVLSFSYWCTDFVLMQRAFAARTEHAARQVPLWAGFGKLAFSLIVVLPGLAAARYLPGLGHALRFDQALPLMMTAFYGRGMLGLGLTAMVASLMSGLAANVSAFAAIWTQDIYAVQWRSGQSDRHYLLMGRASTVVATGASIFTSYLTFYFADIMEHVQMIFSIFGAPFWAIFLLGMLSKRTTARGAVAGFLSGCTLGTLHLVALRRGWLHYGSTMNANFHLAIYSFALSVFVAWLVSGSDSGDPSAYTPEHPFFDWRSITWGRRQWLLYVLSGSLLLACCLLNWFWR